MYFKNSTKKIFILAIIHSLDSKFTSPIGFFSNSTLNYSGTDHITTKTQTIKIWISKSQDLLIDFEFENWQLSGQGC